MSGNTSVTISGGPWDEETIMFTTVMFGRYEAPNVDLGTVASTSGGTTYNSLIATTPPQSAGKVNVTVSTPDNDSGTTTGTFTYEFNVSGIVPTSGTVNEWGDVIAIITGNDLADVSRIDFEDNNPARIGFIDPLHIWAIVPPPVSGAGQVDVKVTSPHGEGKTKFTYG